MSRRRVPLFSQTTYSLCERYIMYLLLYPWKKDGNLSIIWVGQCVWSTHFSIIFVCLGLIWASKYTNSNFEGYYVCQHTAKTTVHVTITVQNNKKSEPSSSNNTHKRIWVWGYITRGPGRSYPCWYSHVHILINTSNSSPPWPSKSPKSFIHFFFFGFFF